MKKIFSILFVFATLFSSCDEKFAEGDFNFYDIEEPENTNTLNSMPEIGKKGIGMTTRLGTSWSYNVSDLKVHWHYSWGSDLLDLEPDNIDFVPMIWGKGIDEERIAELQALKEEGKIRYLLGFNEPDKQNQANMTVDEAIEQWPSLEEVGVPLGSPAPVNPTGDWMQEFMQRADENGLRVDFVCVHWYGGVNPDGLLNKLEEVYDLYGKPIWITEFAPADWDATTPEENRHSPEEVMSFMQTVLPKLEDLGYLQRYAWFSFNQDSPQGTSSALFDEDGNLTALGEFYANFEPNVYIGEGKEPYVDPAIVFQDGFETYDPGADLGGKGYSVWEGNANVASGDAFSGDNFAQCEPNNNSFYFRKKLTLEEGKTYTFEVMTKSPEGKNHKAVAKIGDRNIGGDLVSSTEWTKSSYTFTTGEGETKAIVFIYSWPVSRVDVDDITIKEVVE
ncbi:glycosyl hydrolase [Marinilabilia rubra]|uniref:Asl1-like glycosyl hydrolase catalytic domain-containing protein n=1 Tax=Marinilabilia rubra TaxID=2162893 RepID=A0A2U2B783_9BACT|nr:glycosyl hydrolase [Marinilabilia rubra]PWD98915.1 hypothetical protein DDZ16_13015 [Marinilabilia rubra]